MLKRTKLFIISTFRPDDNEIIDGNTRSDSTDNVYRWGASKKNLTKSKNRN